MTPSCTVPREGILVLLSGSLHNSAEIKRTDKLDISLHLSPIAVSKPLFTSDALSYGEELRLRIKAEPSMVVYPFNSSSQGAEVGSSL